MKWYQLDHFLNNYMMQLVEIKKILLQKQK